jgi:hypothetical protein
LALGLGDAFDGLGNARRLVADGGGDFGVLVIHQKDDFVRGELIELFGGGVARLGREVFEGGRLAMVHAVIVV